NGKALSFPDGSHPQHSWIVAFEGNRFPGRSMLKKKYDIDEEHYLTLNETHGNNVYYRFMMRDDYAEKFRSELQIDTMFRQIFRQMPNPTMFPNCYNNFNESSPLVKD